MSMTGQLDRWERAAPEMDADTLIGFYITFRLQALNFYEGDFPYRVKNILLREMDRRNLIERGKADWKRWSSDQGGFGAWFGPIEMAFYKSEGVLEGIKEN